MTSLIKIREYLGLADIDYLSARLLILNGLPTTGLSKAAEAIEKQFKLFFLLYEKMDNNNELDTKHLKKYGHDLLEMLQSYNDVVPTERKLGGDWTEYLDMLKDSYNRRYPEYWKEWVVKVDVGQLDKAYTYLRNTNTANFPSEYDRRSFEFGTFIGDIFRSDEYIARIKKRGLLSPTEILKLENDSYSELNIDKIT